MNPVRGSWRWTPQEDAVLFRRRHVDGARFKTIAYEFGRSEPTVANRFARLQSKLDHAHRQTLERHREEELELLEKLLIEADSPEQCGDERQ